MKVKSDRNILYIQKELKEPDDNIVKYVFIVDGEIYSEGRMKAKLLYKIWNEYNPIIAFVNKLPNTTKYGK